MAGYDTPHQKALMDMVRKRKENSCGGRPVPGFFIDFYHRRFSKHSKDNENNNSIDPEKAHRKALSDVVWRVGDDDPCSGTPNVESYIRFYAERFAYHNREAIVE